MPSHSHSFTTPVHFLTRPPSCRSARTAAPRRSRHSCMTRPARWRVWGGWPWVRDATCYYSYIYDSIFGIIYSAHNVKRQRTAEAGRMPCACHVPGPAAGCPGYLLCTLCLHAARTVCASCCARVPRGSAQDACSPATCCAPHLCGPHLHSQQRCSFSSVLSLKNMACPFRRHAHAVHLVGGGNQRSTG